MALSKRQAVGRAYRDGTLVCGRVHVTIARDDRLGLTQRERRCLRARFVDRLHPDLQAELAELARRRGSAAQRVAERLEPIVVVIDDPLTGRERIEARIDPPQVRRPYLSDVEFALREPLA